MSVYMKAVGTSGDPGNAYAQKNLTAVDEIYVTISASFDPAEIPKQFIAILGGTEIPDTMRWAGTGWEDDGSDNGGSFSATPDAEDLGTFQVLELHYTKSVNVEAWVSGLSVWNIGGEFSGVQIDKVRIGQSDESSGIGTLLVEYVKIGTTRGGSDIFFDDFSSGTFAAWDGTIGDVSIVGVVVPDTTTATEVSVAFSNSTLEQFPTWVQLDDPDTVQLVSGWQIDRGRSSEFDKTVTGTASINFLDPDGTLDPTNSSSVYFGSIDPMKQVRIRLRNPISGVWSHIFKGFASDWTYEVDVSEKFTKITLDAADAFDLLAALEMTPGHHGDTVPAQSQGEIFFDQGPPGTIGGVGPSRIHKALDDAGWPAGPREVFPGNVLLQAGPYMRLDQLLSVIFDAADAEFPGVANVYISKSGYVTFHGRYTRFDPTNPAYGIQTWNAGDSAVALADATVVPISGLSFRRSKEDVINVSVCTPQLPGQSGELSATDIASITVKDDTSVGTYGWRSAHYENLLTYKGRSDPDTTTFDVDAKDEVKLFSQWIVDNYKNPKTRVEQIVFRSRDPNSFSGPATWDLLCGVEIGDILHLENSHPGGGGFDEDFFVEGIHYDAGPMRQDIPDITLTLDVSPKSYYDSNPFV